jgi:hypothetical protein
MSPLEIQIALDRLPDPGAFGFRDWAYHAAGNPDHERPRWDLHSLRTQRARGDD